MSVTGRYANAFQSVERKLSNQKGSTSCFIFQWQNFCSGNAAAKMFTVKKKRKKNLTAKIQDRYIQLRSLYIIPWSKSYHVSKHYLTKVRNFPSVKFQRVNSFFFAWHVFSIKTTQLCCFSVQAAMENMNINRYDWVLIKLFYQSGLGLDSVCGVLLASLL